jgi:hypothetical protein
MARLTDAFLDGTLSRDAHQEARRRLVDEQMEIRHARDRLESGPPVAETIARYLELANTASLTLQRGKPPETWIERFCG